MFSLFSGSLTVSRSADWPNDLAAHRGTAWGGRGLRAALLAELPVQHRPLLNWGKMNLVSEVQSNCIDTSKATRRQCS